MTKLLLLLFSGLKFGKIFTTGGTMLISVVAYAFIFGWGYAVGFVALMFVHEMGHYFAARHRGLNVGAPTFIPFLGAWIELKDQPHSAETEAFVGLGGPLIGTVGALVVYFLARSYDSTLLLAVAYSGFFLNLFNMIPLSPFDGGRITAVLSPRIWLVGAPLLVALFLWRPSPMILLIVVFAFPSIVSAWRGTWREHVPDGYYEQPVAVKVKYGALYLGLAGFLAAMSHEVHGMLGTLR